MELVLKHNIQTGITGLGMRIMARADCGASETAVLDSGIQGITVTHTAEVQRLC